MPEKNQQIVEYLKKRRWSEGEIACTFLAAGEYNENYVVSDGRQTRVFRINHGTQLGLDNQMEYEYRVLEAVAESGVTPRPFFYDLDVPHLGEGVLLMEYLPGRPLDYRRDLDAAAEIFARVHGVAVEGELLVQDNPARDIAAESHSLLHRYEGPHYPEVRALLLDYHDDIADSAEAMAACYADEDLCIVNTEVNSGNFLIDGSRAWLVDWEKAVISYRYQDLAHFTIPTTTLWKTDVRLSEEQKGQMLARYRESAGLAATTDELYEKNRMMERVITLRALSWCFMAYHEYTGSRRALAHSDTFATITSFLDEAECFLM